ncbi:MAG: hypothetical protein JEZ12_17355 [Desulfobacterium sp.]|nr:hypothetical protein [Desulfobacterium sp.]
MNLRIIIVLSIVCLIFSGGNLAAKTSDANSPAGGETVSETTGVEADRDGASIKMLHSIIELKKNLNERIFEKKSQLKKSTSETEKANLTGELKKLDKMLASANVDFERIATGVDVGLFAEKKAEPFNWKNELISLVEPGIKELKRMTVKARQKTKLKDELSFYQKREPVAREANDNIRELILKTDDKNLKKDIKKLLPEWTGVANQIRNKLEITEMQLAEMEAKEQSLIDSTQDSIKNFFKTRGFFLFIALGACVGLVLFLRFLYLVTMKLLPGYTAKYRPFHIRAIDLVFRVMTLVLTLFVLILVFYVFEDWVLLSLTIIFLMGVGWAAKNTLPIFWHQSRLMLNIGAVREGERIVYHGVPWLVKNINVFTRLENPYLGVTLRVPIEEIMDQVSRTFHPKEPWFPCKRNDWVILADGTRGCVTSLSHEMVELVMRGGAKKVYQTADFLGQTPLNLSVNFRLKIPFGISYDLQAVSTNTVLATLDNYIRIQLAEEGYEESLLNLRVEFAEAGGSSLDLVVIADFNGELAPLYNRLSRAFQRWCVDACTENNWDIPFPQLTVHKAS